MVAVLVVGGCSGDDDEEASSPFADTGGEASTDDNAGAPTGGGGEAEDLAEEASPESGESGAGTGGDNGGPTVPVVPVGLPVQAGRSIIATAELEVEVDDVEDAARRAADAAVGAGGFLAEQDAIASQRSATLVLRVPTEGYDEVLDAAAALGEVLAQRVDTADVTDQVIDLEARIASGQASVARVRDLLAESGDVIQLATVEGELARREAELESLLGQQRVLADQVALATIRLSLTEPPVPAAEVAAEPEDRPGFGGGLERGVDVFLTGASVASAVAGFLVPFVPFVVLAAIAVVVLRRRPRRPAPPRPAPAGA
ncbi:MAG: DUF4349 domain-containing protein [Acidimicrobiia bacterium]|nr:DUF4349 domain-containing protein [Acidimicrobiia bacterium]